MVLDNRTEQHVRQHGGGRPSTAVHGRKAVAPLKLDYVVDCGAKGAAVHGRKAVAPLKHDQAARVESGGELPSTAARPWPH